MATDLASIKPTVLIVHGAWHTPYHYEPLVEALEDLSFPVICPRLPTSDNSVPPKHDGSDNTALIQSHIQSLVDAGKQVILFMHSAGGIVGSNASLPSLLLPFRRNLNLPGGILHLIYLAAFVLPLHTSSTTPFLGQLPPKLHNNGNGTLSMDDPRTAFYKGFSDADTEKYMSRMVVAPLSGAFREMENVPYGLVAATYVVCERDMAMKKEVQEAMSEGLWGGESRVQKRVRRLQGGHFVWLEGKGKAQECARLVQEVWEDARATN